MKLTNPLNKQKSNTKSKSKVKAGGKKQQRPLWQRITVAVIAFVLLGTIGSFGYYKWKERDLKAKAAGMYPLNLAYSKAGIGYYGCKSYVNSAYGPLWKIKIMIIKLPNSPVVKISPYIREHWHPYKVVHKDPESGAFWGGVQAREFLWPVSKKNHYFSIYAYDRYGNTPSGSASVLWSELDKIGIC